MKPSLEDSGEADLTVVFVPGLLRGFVLTWQYVFDWGGLFLEKVGGVLITMCVWKKHSSNMEEMRTRKKKWKCSSSYKWIYCATMDHSYRGYIHPDLWMFINMAIFFCNFNCAPSLPQPYGFSFLWSLHWASPNSLLAPISPLLTIWGGGPGWSKMGTWPQKKTVPGCAGQSIFMKKGTSQQWVLIEVSSYGLPFEKQR